MQNQLSVYTYRRPYPLPVQRYATISFSVRRVRLIRRALLLVS